MAKVEPARTSAEQALQARGYHVPYRGSSTPCPGCGRSHWLVGRLLAQCAFCETAVPLEDTRSGVGIVRVSRRVA